MEIVALKESIYNVINIKHDKITYCTIHEFVKVLLCQIRQNSEKKKTS